MSESGSKPPTFAAWIVRPQTLLALSALLLSLCGLFVAFYEAALIRRAQRASVWPYVQVAASINDDGIELWVQNTGIGPARIRAAGLTHDGELVANWSALTQRLLDGDGSYTYKSLINGQVLPVDSEREVIFAVAEASGSTPALVAALRRGLLEGSVDVEVCYCSVYDECWTASLQNVLARSRGDEVPVDAPVVDDCDAVQRSRI